MAIDRNKPIIEMAEKEFREAFRTLDLMCEVGMSPLARARLGKDQDILIALLMLRRPGQADVIVFSDNEYGDRCGVAMCESVKEDLEDGEDGGLLPGESLYVTLVVARQLEQYVLKQ